MGWATRTSSGSILACCCRLSIVAMAPVPDRSYPRDWSPRGQLQRVRLLNGVSLLTPDQVAALTYAPSRSSTRPSESRLRSPLRRPANGRRGAHVCVLYARAAGTEDEERESRSTEASKPSVGFEPTTPALRERCSGQLSYDGKVERPV